MDENSQCQRLQTEGENTMTRLFRTSLLATLSILAGLAMLAATIALAAAAPGDGTALGQITRPDSQTVRLSGAGGVRPQLAGDTAPSAATAVLYIYRRDTAKAAEFKGLLETTGAFSVTTAAISIVMGMPDSNLGTFNMFMIADDTGSLNEWGASPADATVVARLVAAGKPIIGLGEGGYAFFGKAGSPTGWPNGWHGPMSDVYVGALTGSYFSSPNDLTALVPGAFPLYAAPVNEVAIYMAVAPTITPIGWEPRFVNQKPAPDHASLTRDDCFHLWGFSGGPSAMNDTGKKLFVNAATYMSTYQCTPPPQPPTVNCLTLVKTDAPPSGSSVNPGDSIQYTLTYTVTDDKQCATQRALLVDQLPANTVFVPGSASGGIVPGFGGTMVWDLGGLLQGAIGSKTFAASVLDTACNGSQFVTNTAQVKTNLGTYVSNETSHKVACPSITLPNQDPPYAEREIQVYPYPLVAGQPTRLSVGIDNNGATSQTITVTFQTSLGPNYFGIGLAFNDLVVAGNPRVVTIGPFSAAEVQVNWTPPVSGIHCIRVKIEGAGFTPIYTLSNLDVTEDLQPGVTDTLTFKVGNPTAATADVILVVDNTCPGWTATVSPTVALAVGPKSLDLRTVELRVTPPNPAVLGTGCHIDVQGWIGDKLIGGIRKLDVPPVHLTPGNPTWLEQEITTVPTVPVSGTVNQACVQLQNPLAITKTVTITYSEAVFGAGIGFTPFTAQSFALPPHSLATYCVNWTPLASTALHRCLLVTLHQAGFLDQRSQRNLDIAHLPPGSAPISVSIPIDIGNPLPYTSTITLDGRLIGLSGWMPAFTPAVPLVLGPGATQRFTLRLVPAVIAQTVSAVTAGPTTFGDVVRADVTLSLDGEPYSGFSVDLTPPLRMFLPLVLRTN